MAVMLYKHYFKNIIFQASSTLRAICNRKGHSHVVMTDDTNVIVCWHPEEFFPYEKSLPIEEKKKVPHNSILKVQSSKELLSVLKPKKEEFVRQELMAMTHTTKHIWFPRKFQFRRKKVIEKNRPYL